MNTLGRCYFGLSHVNIWDLYKIQLSQQTLGILRESKDWASRGLSKTEHWVSKMYWSQPKASIPRWKPKQITQIPQQI